MLRTVAPRRLRLRSQTAVKAWGLPWDLLGRGLMSVAVLSPGVVYRCANTLKGVERRGAGSRAGKYPLL